MIRLNVLYFALLMIMKPCLCALGGILRNVVIFNSNFNTMYELILYTHTKLLFNFEVLMIGTGCESQKKNPSNKKTVGKGL
jgi:hypothetical protein